MAAEFQVFPIQRSPGYLICRAAAGLDQGIYRAFSARGFNFTGEQWALLSSLWEREGLTQSELAQRVHKDRPNITRMLSVLERRGLVVKKNDPRDKRCLRVFLTPEGRELQAQLTPMVLELLERVLAGLGREDLRALERIQGTIINNLERLDAEDGG